MGLTLEQRKIVESIEGHYVILAGPGCGKTRTIIEKILYLFEKNKIPEPYGILAVTFTEAAAYAMRTGLRSRGFKDWDRIRVNTFHSLGAYILRCYGSDIGIREDFKIIEDDRRLAILNQLIEKYPISTSPSQLDDSFERLKRKGIYPEEGKGNLLEIQYKIYKEYQDNLRKENYLDFGDLVALAVKLLNKSNFVKRIYTNFFRYVMVDEFQDTDEQQLELIRILAENAIGSTIVGDDDQSIYCWRGALRENVFKIKRLLNSTEVVLELNFRSDEIIVDAASKVIGIDSNRRDKAIKSVSKERGHLYKYQFENPTEEAKFITDWIINGLKNTVISKLESVVVISRTHDRTIWLKQEMDKFGIAYFEPYKIHFRISWESKLGLAILEIALNPTSSLALSRLLTIIEEGGIAYCLGFDDGLDISRKICDQFKISDKIDLIPNNVGKILKISGIWDIIKQTSSSNGDAERRTLNLNKMINDIISEAETHHLNLETIIKRFLGYDAIQIITGHYSKGTEFDVVFFIGLEDDLLPLFSTHGKPDEIAEERRIFYVGLTRARKIAYLSSVARRPVTHWIKSTIPSRFLRYIPEEFFDEIKFPE